LRKSLAIHFINPKESKKLKGKRAYASGIEEEGLESLIK